MLDWIFKRKNKKPIHSNDCDKSTKEYDRYNSAELLRTFNQVKNSFYNGQEEVSLTVNNDGDKFDFCIELTEDKDKLNHRITIAEQIISDLQNLDNKTQDRLEELSLLPNQGYSNWQSDLAYIDVNETEPKLVYWCRQVATEWVTLLKLNNGKWQTKNF